MADLKNKRAITVAVTGAWPTRADNPHLPITPREIADDVYECWQAGAAAVHLHVRNDDGTPCTDIARYEETVGLIRARKDCDICINITSSGGDLQSGHVSTAEDDEARIAPIRALLPELSSYDCGTLNWQNRTLFENHPRFLETLGRTLQELDVKPEIEIFDAGMLTTARYYIKAGVLKTPCHFQLILGAAGGSPATMETLTYLHSLLPADCTWSAVGIGRGHLPIMLGTIALGGHLRVGMEDNVFYRRGVPADSNAQFVARAKRLLEEADLEAAIPEEMRQIMGLSRKVL